MGDLNEDQLDRPNGHITDLCELYGLKQLIKSPTRTTRNTTSLLDIIMISSIDLCVKSGTEDSFFSDHNPTCVIF